MPVRIRHLFISPGHNYFGRHGKVAGLHPILEVDVAECVAGRGLMGDRFFDYKSNYRGQITFFSWEVFESMKRDLRTPDASPSALRRNVIVEGLELSELIGKRFELDNVIFEGVEECRPCYWMDQAVGQGAEFWLKNRGGLRCRIQTDGQLRKAGDS